MVCSVWMVSTHTHSGSHADLKSCSLSEVARMYTCTCISLQVRYIVHLPLCLPRSQSSELLLQLLLLLSQQLLPQHMSPTGSHYYYYNIAFQCSLWDHQYPYDREHQILDDDCDTVKGYPDTAKCLSLIHI